MCKGPPGGPSHALYVHACIRGRNGDGVVITSSLPHPGIPLEVPPPEDGVE